MFELRGGEVALAEDPAGQPGDAHLVFIGVIRSSWTRREDCPKNMREARERGRPATVEILPAYRQGLQGLQAASHVAILTWLHHAPRNLIVQKPRHASEAKGVFALRTPVRPNPVGLHIVRLLDVDPDSGILRLEAIDVLDGTPVIDLKPYFVTTDAVPDATYERPGEPAADVPAAPMRD
ncbi:tRNA (N6-threonylcarbamoyladenosine(37)-N6)-methyltransferase TrmO [Pseudaminobacter sp. 19-2017]|uniref:tRNA (N6-threonylcarbamoyladenosine(37)-N6)-methyltransferase TrmO n=1 Tax=Pseudaminobacter soli (ex Zhang et al. 2022) TaxID=2831468 RepID=A0A942DXB6_9HYPH|nr:tRNA (N6-threonylcarbamoyladenosine(37)-N6)-methyltransferase TrmO [Pseudaminobacter soli]MBS3649156.1 tRNA (N6-threonylcarbamoyladenosine(37)-N6)-methyltransferase TrmO [Pseudaminobacter soli]